jgi:hypothetical protein
VIRTLKEEKEEKEEEVYLPTCMSMRTWRRRMLGGGSDTSLRRFT